MHSIAQWGLSPFGTHSSRKNNKIYVQTMKFNLKSRSLARHYRVCKCHDDANELVRQVVEQRGIVDEENDQYQQGLPASTGF